MDKSQVPENNNQFSFTAKHRFVIMISSTILIALILVVIGMTLYNNSGAAQLDLSRPGYKDVRTRVVTNDDFQDYSSTGPINQTTIAEFETLYIQQAKKTESVDAFGGDPLSPEALGLSASETTTTQ
jgi:hypothetical protein